MNIGEYVVYRRKEVCKIVDIKKSHFNNEDYFTLVPISDNSLKLDVPVSNSETLLRKLITKEEVGLIIESIPLIPVIECNEKMYENEYKLLLNEGGHYNFIRIIKTTYLRNKERIDNKKKVSDRDNRYFELAEKYLYMEFSVVLGLSYDDTKEYVIKNVMGLEGK